ncbi:uncharacterized protein LOC124308841 isoform X2 [Neodiprion virginianus]|uniref:uncharacterized protein LOC124308841 isoform X2 n=1 Tax=Neodiprion virginianus TaxID=2961670 RepID=UPI001EE71664|nr:uncharacterized protein LOC124308841 isoform X2 [Neodiprion virginianus]
MKILLLWYQDQALRNLQVPKRSMMRMYCATSFSLKLFPKESFQISNTLGGITTDDAKKRWQYVRDCEMKEKTKQQTYTPSGSAAGALKKPSFRHYDLYNEVCGRLVTEYIKTTFLEQN